MNTLKFLVVVSMVLLVYNQTVNGIKQHPLGYNTTVGCMNYWNNDTSVEYPTNIKHLCDWMLPIYHTYQGCINHWKNDTVLLKEHNFTIEQVCEGMK